MSILNTKVVSGLVFLLFFFLKGIVGPNTFGEKLFKGLNFPKRKWVGGSF